MKHEGRCFETARDRTQRSCSGASAASGESAAKRLLPGWIEAIGAQIALRFDYTREPLSEKMDAALERIEAKEARRPDHLEP